MRHARKSLYARVPIYDAANPATTGVAPLPTSEKYSGTNTVKNVTIGTILEFIANLL